LKNGKNKKDSKVPGKNEKDSKLPGKEKYFFAV